MKSTIRESLIEALDSGTDMAKSTMDAEVRDVLVTSLEGATPTMDEAIEGLEKRKRGRPRKDECKAKDPSKCWKHGFAGDILEKREREKSRNRDRLNPLPTRDDSRELDLFADLRDVGYDISDAPDNKADTKYMRLDLDNLRREAGLKKLDEGFKPYAAYLKKWQEYEDYKKHCQELHRQTGLTIKSRHYDDAEELIQTLRKKADGISGKYAEILDAYDECSDALCELIEASRKATQGAEQTETARQGYGMMDGEDFKAYKKRMGRIGRSKEIPKTIEKIDSIVAATERRWRSIAGLSQDEFDVVKKNFRKMFSNLMTRCSLATNRGIKGINGVLEGHLQSQHDFVKKGQRFDDGNYSHHGIIGGNRNDPRYRFSEKCFGVDFGLPAGKYEKYGCLHTLHPSENDNLMGSEYGQNVIRWKPHKTVATMTFTDSLCLARAGLNYVNPCLVTNPSPCCFNPANRDMIETLKRKPVNIGLDSICTWSGTPYVELQLHGEDQYDASAIDSISFGSKEDVRNLSPKAIATILEHKIPLYIKTKPITIDERGRIKSTK